MGKRTQELGWGTLSFNSPATFKTVRRKAPHHKTHLWQERRCHHTNREHGKESHFSSFLFSMILETFASIDPQEKEIEEIQANVNAKGTKANFISL